ncbi:hypothetical protein [Terriglobus sp. RCC_193]|uniref:hypothetical protein n=1 Tax=Terriglobus sp. RCC_193 TaxID=3239218 RepID=UPI0035267D20
MMKSVLLSCALLTAFISVSAQGGMAMNKPAAVPSTSLTVTGLTGTAKTFSAADFKALPHVTVNVHNVHTNKDESYSGVPVKELLALVAPAKGEGPKVSGNMTLIIAGATDGFQVAITLCDTNPDCRNGQSIVADALDGVALAQDGAFKLVLSEDKKPARWARNLQSLTVKAAQ